jgi:hypothetical protein
MNINWKNMAVRTAFLGSLFIPQFAHAACAVQAASAFPYSVPAVGGTGAVQIYAPPGCPWYFHNRGVAWIQILSAQSGTGSAVISYRVLPNTGRARAAAFGPEGVDSSNCGTLGGRSSTGCGPLSTGFAISLTQAGH